MALHVVVGAGPVGTATATLLAERGEAVRVVTRRGGGPEHPAVERVAADAADAERLAALTEGAAVLYNCANPQYHQWFTDWPPIAASLLKAAERTGAVLATASNLYGYGPVTGPITPDTPLAATHPKMKLRADMFRDALALHEAGRIQMVEVRASDYIEANSIFSDGVAKPMLAGKRVLSPAPLDVPHSWTSIRDVARTLTAAAADGSAHGRGWLVPTNEPLTIRQIAQRLAEVRGLGEARIGTLPYAVLWFGGLFDPIVKELRATRYQFAEPFVIDSSLTEKMLGLAPSPLEDALRAVGA